MKNLKVSLSLVTVLVTTLFASSCKKCQTCTVTYTYGGQTYTEKEELCQDDFDSKDQYKAYIKLIEASGGKCK